MNAENPTSCDSDQYQTQDRHRKTNLSPIQKSSLDYIRADFKLVPLRENDKRPYLPGWNLLKQCVSTLNSVQYINKHNIGIAHAFSGTCAIDIDDYDQTAIIFADQGIDLDALMMADDAVQIRSGRANRGKLLYRLTEPLQTIQHAINGKMAFEFRCATKDGSTVQDALPPSIHPDTGKPYEWFGDWRNIPQIPEAVLALWTTLQTTPEEPQKAIPHRSNTPSVGDASFMPVAALKKGFKKSLTTEVYRGLLRDNQAQIQMLEWLGFSEFKGIFSGLRVSTYSVIGDDEHKSGGLLVSQDGRVLFRDFRGVMGDSPVSLPRLMAYLSGCHSWSNGEGVSHAVWGVRLMLKSGVLTPADVDMPPCPDGRDSLHAVYAGIKLLFQCRWRYEQHKGKPIMLARRFVSQWCGVTEDQARDAVRDLLKSEVIHTAEKKGSYRFFKPGGKKSEKQI